MKGSSSYEPIPDVKFEDEITVDAIPLEHDDSKIDPMNTGFKWYLPDEKAYEEDHRLNETKWTISGHDMQVLSASIPPGDTISTEVGSMLFSHPDMKLDVDCTLCQGSTGCRRMCGGESCVKVDMTNEGGSDAYVGLTPNFPAKIIPLSFGGDIKPGSSLIAKSGAIMTHLGDVDVGCNLDANPLTGCCAGLGICRQKLNQTDGGRPGMVFLNAGGTIVMKELAANETVTIDGGCLVGYEDTVKLGVAYAGRCFTCFCGGEGLFNTTMTGPGKIYMQSMSFRRYGNAVRTTVVEERTSGAAAGGSEDADIDAADGGVFSLLSSLE
eukprot:CAMPEP_0194355936 /NCGR_PEP_ID=MMETSP0174-20130528/3772_1 /TAXON_ID=216777 /ORGANISM="Proboscia alata, Strain PI-D3" /LENGTH=324 /DNA_ID=CAMNT_0039125417 /DNA_START=9 /DNA_END=983 /DNA_ORIENTATION=+